MPLRSCAMAHLSCKSRLPIIFLLAVLLLCSCSSRAFGAQGETGIKKSFAQFDVVLPDGWDGDEQTGFISDNPEEYQLTLGRKDDTNDHFLAQVSIFLLPNKPGVEGRQAASTLAEAQGEPSEPHQVDNFWVFEGEPRSRTIKGRATTMVNATPENLLIIIAQDPQNLGAGEIISSLSGLTPVAKKLLGR